MIAGWDWKYMDVRLHYPIPVFPHYHYLMSSPGPAKAEGKSLQNLTILASLEGMYGASALRFGPGWSPSSSFGQMRQKDKTAKEKRGAQQAHLIPKHHDSRTPSGVGCGQTIKLHLKKAIQGPGWTHVESKDPGPDV